MPPREQNLENLKLEKQAKTDLALNLIKITHYVSNSGTYNKFLIPDKKEKKKLYDIARIDYKKYSRSTDGVLLERNVKNIDSVKNTNDFYFLEIKATKSKTVKELPYGVFFGFTENEENLFKKHANYRLCFIHVALKKYYIMDYREYSKLIQTSKKRIQYQITFRSNKG